MTITYKVLGQSNPSATTNTTLYVVPAATSAVVSTLNVCNQSPNLALFRIAIQPANAAITSKHYLSYDTAVPGNDSLAFTIGMTLAATDVVTVYANTTSVSFNLFGSEIS